MCMRTNASKEMKKKRRSEEEQRKGKKRVDGKTTIIVNWWCVYIVLRMDELKSNSFIACIRHLRPHMAVHVSSTISRGQRERVKKAINKLFMTWSLKHLNERINNNQRVVMHIYVKVLMFIGNDTNRFSSPVRRPNWMYSLADGVRLICSERAEKRFRSN